MTLSMPDMVHRPPVLRRRLFWFIVVAIVIVVAGGVGFAIKSVPPWGGGLVGPAAVGVVLMARRDARRFLKKVRSLDHRMCPDCGYLLTGSPEEGVCPECGSAYTKMILFDRWEAWDKRCAGKPNIPQSASDGLRNRQENRGHV